jgi:superfamily II DNA helicase RecQ
MAREIPRDAEAMLRIPGIGAVKLDRYGDVLLEALAEE